MWSFSATPVAACTQESLYLQRVSLDSSLAWVMTRTRFTLKASPPSRQRGRHLPATPESTRRRHAYRESDRRFWPGGEFDTRNDSINAAYLADIAALVTKTPGWCARIPGDLPLVTQRAGFRDWCFFTLANDTRTPDLCRLIPVRANEADPRLSLRSKCDVQARSPYPGGHYDPEVPDNDERTRALIAMLHYEIPRAKDLLLAIISAGYQRFLQELNGGAGPRHAAARQRFIARVRARSIR